MTTPTPNNTRFAVRVLLLILLDLAFCAAVAVQASGAKSVGSARQWSAYREPGDEATIGEPDARAIYEVALRFYRPPKNQYRRLELRLLPASPGDTTRRELSRSLAQLLVSKLGDRFLMPGEASRQDFGAELRVSDLYATSPDTVRVIVGCQMVWPHGTTTDNEAQAFEIVRKSKGWAITDRGGVATPK